MRYSIWIPFSKQDRLSTVSDRLESEISKATAKSQVFERTLLHLMGPKQLITRLFMRGRKLA